MMFEKSLNYVLEQTKGHKVVIVGAGIRGREVAGALIDRDYEVISFFDNNVSLWGLDIYGIPVSKPDLIPEQDVYYIVCVDDGLKRYRLKTQLFNIGIQKDRVVCYFSARCIEYNELLIEGNIKKEIDAIYYEKFGKRINWSNPKTYNEKINCEKIGIQDERRVMLADKSQARKWVSEKIGNEHITRHYGVWDKADNIDFDKLPDKFVLKANNGSGRNILVKDKSKLNIDDILDHLNYWMSSNYMFESFEIHYGKIRPCIISEEYLEGLAESLYDYNIYCFHGEPKYIWCIKGSHRAGCCATFYDTQWKAQPFSYGYPLDVYPAPRPEKLEEMLELTRVLCKGFEHVRVDWYIIPDGRLLFGEMTFQTWGGMNMFIPGKYDEYFGSLI